MAARKKTTVYLDPTLLKAVKVQAAVSGRHDYEVVEDALRRYLGSTERGPATPALVTLLDELSRDHEPIGDDEAMRIAYEELHAYRAELDA